MEKQPQQKQKTQNTTTEDPQIETKVQIQQEIDTNQNNNQQSKEEINLESLVNVQVVQDEQKTFNKPKKTEITEEESDDSLDDCIGGMGKKLNLTFEEEKESDLKGDDQKFEKEFQTFMKSMNKEPQIQEAFNNMQNFLGEMLKEMPKETQKGDGSQQNAQQMPPMEGMPEMPQMSNGQMPDMFKDFDDDEKFDQFAETLLQEFMSKEILFEPLQEAKEKYKSYLDSKKDLDPVERKRFVKQQKCVDELIQILEQDKYSKQELMTKFEEMQSYGMPPSELMGDDNKMGTLFGQGGGLGAMMGGGGFPGGMPGQQNGPSPLNPEDGCIIF